MSKPNNEFLIAEAEHFLSQVEPSLSPAEIPAEEFRSVYMAVRKWHLALAEKSFEQKPQTTKGQ